ncbi:FAD-dependent oxidoreductase [Deinococcus sp.]|uniref:FAD-dependent oxidoreductase n=1 Tax=Deinococcus sp. TaxID=47478 RepID=UPI0025C6FB1C|nr:FAD-dependent oxidoreductase [Deinococcus sp.]
MTTSPSTSPLRAAAPGRVWAHVGQPFTEPYFDLVVVGAGRMGAALTLYLRQLLPHRSVLLIEEGGLPNEEGATILAPGIWSTLDLPVAQQEQARWTRTQLETALGDVQWRPRALAELHTQETPGARPTREALADFPEALHLINPEQLPFARLDGYAATYRPGNVALNAAQQAIKLGANLLLNTRAVPLPAVSAQTDSGSTGSGLARLKLERLTVTNTHQIVTHETLNLRAGVTVIAAGAAGPALAEHQLGVHTAHGRAYQQYPRLEQPSREDAPILRTGPLTLRPQHGGYTLIPAPHHRDPHGYQPTAGHLTGVQTGLRRELLEDLVALMPAVPALAAEGLQVGRSLSDLPGAWVSLPGGRVNGWPLWEELTPEAFLLLGGPSADTLGLWVAHDLAAELARRQAAVGERQPM